MVLKPAAEIPDEALLVREAAQGAYREARTHAKDPVVALRAAVLARSAPLEGELVAERAARLAEALGKDFDREHGTGVIADETGALRLAEAAVRAVIELRRNARTEVNLPFLSATGEGPKHLLRAVDRETLADLDRQSNFQVRIADPAPAPEPPAPEPAKKKWWWPFG